MLVVEKVPPLSSFMAAAVSPRGASGTADQSQSYPGEGTSQESPESRAMVRKRAASRWHKRAALAQPKTVLLHF